MTLDGLIRRRIGASVGILMLEKDYHAHIEEALNSMSNSELLEMISSALDDIGFEIREEGQ